MSLPGIVLHGLVMSLPGVMLIVAVALASESYVPAVAGRDRLLRANVLVFAATPVVGFLVGLVFDGFRRLSLPVVMVPLVAAVVTFWTMRTPVVAAPRVSFGEVVRLTRTQPVIRAISGYVVLTALAEPPASGHRLPAHGFGHDRPGRRGGHRPGCRPRTPRGTPRRNAAPCPDGRLRDPAVRAPAVPRRRPAVGPRLPGARPVRAAARLDHDRDRAARPVPEDRP
ncbi:MAG: hypothetical protein HOY71_44105 [Nonomuraea sp.]|nr:hypothetical protein [Nonomuraea sp.]